MGVVREGTFGRSESGHPEYPIRCFDQLHANRFKAVFGLQSLADSLRTRQLPHLRSKFLSGSGHVASGDLASVATSGVGQVADRHPEHRPCPRTG
jgi:hypothetical protein